MYTPAAKRRRVEATKTLTKPFRCPLVARPPPAGDSSSASGAQGAAGSAKAETAEEPPPGEASGSSDVPRGRSDGDEERATSKTPLAQGSKGKGRARRALTPFRSPFNPNSRPVRYREGPASGNAGDGADKVVAAGDANAEEGEELRELIVKWRAASRMAAEVVFDYAKKRVDNAGGPKAWRQSQRRWEDGREEGEKRSNPDDDPDAPSTSERNSLGGGGGDSADGDDEEPAFTIGLMLKSLNIAPEVLGYNEEEDNWDD